MWSWIPRHTPISNIQDLIWQCLKKSFCSNLHFEKLRWREWERGLRMISCNWFNASDQSFWRKKGAFLFFSVCIQYQISCFLIPIEIESQQFTCLTSFSILLSSTTHVWNSLVMQSSQSFTLSSSSCKACLALPMRQW